MIHKVSDFTLKFLHESGASHWVPALVLAWLHGLSMPQPKILQKRDTK